MERLTVHGATSQRDIDRLMELSNENQFGRNKAYYRLQEYEDLGFTPQDIAIMAKFYKEQTSVESVTANLKIVESLIELDKYKKLEAAGKLIKLPCAVGDTMWEVDFDLKYMDEFKITDITITEDGIGFENPYMGFGFSSEDLGKTVFLTHAEAESALERSIHEKN